ncbi:MAG: PilN domain-containing protein [bacterium]|nr:PilN domain-containing protein [bacterium]
MSGKREINLIPQDVVERDRGVKRIGIWSLIIGMVLVSILGLAGLEKQNSGAVQEVIEALKTRNKELETKLHRLAQLQQQRDRLARKEKAIHSLLVKRSLCGLFTEIEKVMNGNVWLTAVEYKDRILAERKDRDGREVGYTSTGYINIKDDAFVPAESAENGGGRIETHLKGMAVSYRDIADFLEQLLELDLFRQVKLRRVHAVKMNDMGLVEFELVSLL